MKWILIALVLLALAFIVYAAAGRRGTNAGREAASDLRGDLAPPSRTASEPTPPAVVASGADTDVVDDRATIFDAPVRADEPVAADEPDAVPATAEPAAAESTEPEEGEMFGWGKDKKDEAPEHDEAQDVVVADEGRHDDYVPRRGAGIDDAEGAADGGGDAVEDADGAVDQPSWTTSAHDPDHTVPEERTDGERTTFDDDVTTTAEEDRTAESHEGAFDADGGDDVVTDAPADEADGIAGDEGEGAADLREEHAADDTETSANADTDDSPSDDWAATDQDATAADASEETAASGEGGEPSSGDEAASGDPTVDSDDVGVEPGQASEEDEAAAAERGSDEAYEAGQQSAGGETRDDDALEGASDGSVGSGAMAPAPAAGSDDGSADDTAADDAPADDAPADDAPAADDAPGEDVTTDASSDADAGADHEAEGAGSSDEGLSTEEADSSEFRQRGDWVADEDGPEIQSADGTADGSSDGGDGAGWTRRTSELDEVTDGGYGVGSAATLEDRAMPLGHPVKAWEDTKTFVDESHPAYEDAEPHVWFSDNDAAESAGFRRVD